MARHVALYWVGLLGLSLAMGSWALSDEEAPLRIRIGSSETSKVAHRAAEAVCELTDRTRKRFHADCKVVALPEPREVLERFQEGELEAAVLSSYWQNQQGDRGLRAMFALDAQSLIILVHPEKNIVSGDDLVGGHIRYWDSAEYGGAFKDLNQAVFQAASFEEAALKNNDQSDLAQLLCDQKEVDALLVFTAHPNPIVKAAVEDDCAKLVPLSLDANKIEVLRRTHPYYRVVNVPAKVYENAEPVATVAVGTTFVSWKDVGSNEVYVVVRTVFENFLRFQALYPPADQLALEKDREQPWITDDFRSVPWHPGAAQYFAEVEWESWFYVIIASYEQKQNADALVTLLNKKLGAEIDGLEPMVLTAHNGVYAVSASPKLKKARAGALSEALQKHGLEGKLVPAGLFF